LQEWRGVSWHTDLGLLVDHLNGCQLQPFGSTHRRLASGSRLTDGHAAFSEVSNQEAVGRNRLNPPG
jgi:hypothetical protein